VDTVSFAWRPQDPRLWRHLEEALKQGRLPQGSDLETSELCGSTELARGARGSGVVKGVIGGGRVFFYPHLRLICIEGRLAALLAGDENASGLAPSWQLGNAADVAARNVSTRLYPATISLGKSSLRRIDLTCDLCCNSPSQGLRLLRGLEALSLPRLKTNAYKKDGRVETIYFVTPKRAFVHLRLYDKSVESKSGTAGTLIRLEQQRRFVGKQQPSPHEWARADLGRQWQGQLKAWEAAEDVVVADLNGMQRVILQAVSEGKLSAFKAERLLGTLLLRGRGMGKDWWTAQGKPHLWGRRERELRDLGLILDEDGLGREKEEAELPLGTVLRALRLAWPPAIPQEAC
jgi:hypothetical protein